jgi:hypothetical protein
MLPSLAPALQTPLLDDDLVCSPAVPCASVTACRSNYYGQLGLGDRIDRGTGLSYAPMGKELRRVNLGWKMKPEVLALGEFFTCVLLQPGGVVKCWG